jgi:glycosyltransferase involved in cell wall biosynthesis
MRKLAVVTNIPTPYRVPLFRRLADTLPDAGWEVEVLFGSRGNARRRWVIGDDALRFPHRFLEGRNVTLGRERVLNTYRGLSHALAEVRADAVVAAGYSAGTMVASMRARRAGLPFAIWSGTIDGRAERSWIRRVQRRWLVRRCDGFLAYGSAARDYLVDLGAPDERIHLAWNTVETEAFARGTPMRAPREGEPLRIVTVGYLERRKRVDRLIAAVAAARREGANVELVVVGDGAERATLEAQAHAEGLGGRVRFTGDLPRTDVAAQYREAHLFGFPTAKDIWGLVLVEAMAAGLPALASKGAGAARDLVVEGGTGFALDFDDTAKVGGTIARLAQDPETLERMGRAARDRVREGFTLDHSIEAWRDLVRGF